MSYNYNMLMKLPNQENLLRMAVQNSKSKIHQWCLVSLDYTQWHRNLLARNSMEVDSPLTYYPMVTHKGKGGFELVNQRVYATQEARLVCCYYIIKESTKGQELINANSSVEIFSVGYTLSQRCIRA